MLLSCFSRCGFLRLSGKDPLPKTIYRSMVQQKQGAFDMTVGGPEEAETFADAMALGRVRATLQRAGNQAYPERAYDCLPLLEQDFVVTPGARDTVPQRQGVLVGRERLTRGATFENIASTLRAVLGANFLGYKTLVGNAPTTYPVNMLASTLRHSARVDVPAKWVKILDPITTLGSPVVVRYANLDKTQADVLLTSTDVCMVQPGNTAVMEEVALSAAAGTGASKTFTATFTKAHDPGAIVTTMNFPWQWTTRRHNYVVVTAAAAVDREQRRKVDEFMSRVLRGVSTWSIVQPTSPGALTIGPDALPYPLGTVSIGSLSFTLAP